jgi:putative phosphoribosyl transferase
MRQEGVVSTGRHASRPHDVTRFADRSDAGRLLGEAVARLKLDPPVIVLGLPRGGVPVASEVAKRIDAPLDVLVVRKIGMPGQRELAIGAIAAGDVVVHEPGAAPFLGSLEPPFSELAAAERRELRRREIFYRRGLPPLDLKDRNVVLVDDGIATGSTMLAAIRAARRFGARSVTAAAPVAAPQSLARVAAEADQVAVLETPEILFAVGEWYDRFEQLEDIEVCVLLAQGARRHPFKAPQT